MSLYGTGRGEGVSAALLASALVLFARGLGVWLGDDGDLLPGLQPAWLPALGAALCYRFLRAQSRSRYAAFLVATAYGLSPWLLAMHISPREQLAAALAPLALEAACRCDRPTHRSQWLPWAWAGIAAPFVAGVTVVGMLCGMLCAALVARTVLCGDRANERPLLRGVLGLGVLAAIAASNLAWLDVLAPWLPPADVVSPEYVLSAHRPHDPGFDVAAVLRVPGPVLLTLAMLGVLRRQRHVDTGVWSAIALAGGLPTLFAAVPWLLAAAPAWASHPMLPAGAWWLTLLAVSVLGAAGLDDFLDLPQRRRTALPWLLALAVIGAPWLPVCGARVPDREWPLTATFVALGLMLPAWRQLGILRFKNWLTTMALVALAIPMLQVQSDVPYGPPMPLGEIAKRPPDVLDALAARPPWHYAGLALALVGGCLLALSAWRRTRHTRIRPKAAKAAIAKKAKPSKRR
jgi:hypothetical protein